jgi:H+-transporting ATPase
MMAGSAVNLSFCIALAPTGTLLAPLPLSIVAGLLAGAVAFALLLDTVKLAAFHRLNMA